MIFITSYYCAIAFIVCEGSGIIATAITYPFDIMRTQFAMQVCVCPVIIDTGLIHISNACYMLTVVAIVMYVGALYIIIYSVSVFMG
jgi:hypothetical protein